MALEFPLEVWELFIQNLKIEDLFPLLQLRQDIQQIVEKRVRDLHFRVALKLELLGYPINMSRITLGNIVEADILTTEYKRIKGNMRVLNIARDPDIMLRYLSGLAKNNAHPHTTPT